jgi:hypothetical protein
LEHHPDGAAKSDDLHIAVEDAFSNKLDFAGVVNAFDEFVHSVEVPEQGGFSTPRWANESGDLFFRDIHVDIEKGLFFPVEEIEVPYGDEVSPSRFMDSCGRGLAGVFG